MKKAILLFAFFSICLTTFAQQGVDYYWASGEKISVQKNPETFILHFKEAAKFDNFSAVKKRRGLSKIESFSRNQFVIVQQSTNQNKSANDLLQSLDLSNDDVVIHEALQLDDGFLHYPMDEVVIKMKRREDPIAIKQLAKKFNAELQKQQDDIYIYKMKDINMVLAFANLVEESGLVQWATPDFYAPIVKDNDPNYGEQFQLNNTGQTIDGVTGLNDMDVDAPEAWTMSTGSASITVAVMDDGVEAHEDLVDESGNSRVLNGFTPSNGGNGAPETGGDHGQAVSGIIAASHNNIGVRGLAPKVKILPVNILNGSTTQQIADGYTFARLNGADVFSSSWSYQSCTANYSNITQAITDVANLGRNGKGAFMAFTAGNNGRSNCINYPARLQNVIAVGAVTQIGEHASYSNQGPNIDIVAPSRAASTQAGAGVRTIDRMGAKGYNSGNYSNTFGGTSAACPVVSGCAALVLSVNPNLTKDELENILKSTASDMGASGFDNTYGNGRVNAYQAVLAAGSTTNPTCTDGVQNGDETGIDCGGSNCNDCLIAYCSATGSNSNYEYIDKVQLGSINNTSGNNGSYADFTNLYTSLGAGNSYTITLTPGFQGTVYNEFWSVWIDYNKDGDFIDAGEKVFEGTNGSATISGSFSVPTSVSDGNTRMRISMKWNAYAASACETFNYGEIEDYGILLIAGSTSSCSDGIQNGNETGVDCGGPDCAPCFTCNDGIQNGNETGVDCGGPDCAPCQTSSSCDLISFTTSSPYGYGGAQDKGEVIVLDENAIKIENNAWKVIDFDYNITPNTMISFEYASTVVGEISGIGLDNNLSLSSNYTFKLAGSQNWGLSNYNNYNELGTWKSYTIPVGDFYTGNFNYLFFVSDFDASPQNSNAYFRNIQVFENSNNCVNPNPLDGSPIDQGGDYSAEGNILIEKWSDIGGGLDIELIPVSTIPTSTQNINISEKPFNTGDNYEVRMRGYMCPPQTGNYTFWISSNDNGELWLSTNDEVVNKQLIANLPGWTPSKDWTKYPQRKSVEIALVEGQCYYLEAFVKEQTGGYNLAVEWTLLNGVIERPNQGSYLSPGGPITDFNNEDLKEELEYNVMVFPNPTSGLINIKSTGATYQNATLGVFNANGQMLKTIEHNNQHTVIDMEAFDNGLYIIQILKMNGETEILKIVKT